MDKVVRGGCQGVIILATFFGVEVVDRGDREVCCYRKPTLCILAVESQGVLYSVALLLSSALTSEHVNNVVSSLPGQHKPRIIVISHSDGETRPPRASAGRGTSRYLGTNSK